MKIWTFFWTWYTWNKYNLEKSVFFSDAANWIQQYANSITDSKYNSKEFCLATQDGRTN